MKKSTARTSDNKEAKAFLEWAAARKKRLNKRTLTSSNTREININNLCFPDGEPYKWPCPAISLWEKPSLKFLNSRPSWIVRDGLVPLLWFFSENPTPKGFRTKLVIHHWWENAIPEPWRSHCELYELHSSVKPEIEKRKRWVTFTVMSPAFCSVDFAEKKIKDLLKERKLNSLAKNAPVFASFHIRWETLGAANRAHNEAFVFEFSRTLGRFVQGPVYGHHWHLFRHETAMKDAIALDLNQRLICSDDAALHFFLSKGAAYLQNPARKNTSGRRLALSRSHYALISKTSYKNTSVWSNPAFHARVKYLQNLQKMFPREFQREWNFPWPAWVEELVPEFV